MFYFKVLVVMSVPNTIFIDTNIFHGVGFNFYAARIDAIKEIAKRTKITLIIPKPVEIEIKRHMYDMASENIAALKAVNSKSFLLKKLVLWPLTTSTGEELVDELFKGLLADYDNFLSLFEVIRLDYSKLDMASVMQCWELREAPFSRKKPNEFIDAISLSIIQQYQKAINSKVAIISGDGDLKSACEIYSELVYYENILAYSESYTPDMKQILSIKRALSRNSDLEIAIYDTFLKSNFSYQFGWDAHITDIKINSKHSSLNEFYVLSNTPTGCVAVFSGIISVSFEVSYQDIEIEGIELDRPELFEKSWSTSVAVSGEITFTMDEEYRKVTKLNDLKFDEDQYSLP